MHHYTGGCSGIYGGCIFKNVPCTKWPPEVCKVAGDTTENNIYYMLIIGSYWNRSLGFNLGYWVVDNLDSSLDIRSLEDNVRHWRLYIVIKILEFYT